MNEPASQSSILKHEQAILAILLNSATARAAKMAFLKPNDFADSRHATIYTALFYMFDKFNNVFDAGLVMAHLQNSNQLQNCGGVSYLAEILNLYTTDAFLERYFETLMNASIKRKLNELLVTTQKQLSKTIDPEGLFKNLHLQMTELEIDYKRQEKNFLPVADLLATTHQQLKHQAHEQQQIYFSTSFAELDQKTGGLQPSELVILAGRPSMGKTALALNLIFNDFFFNKNTAASDAGDIIFFSLEMSPQQLCQRILKTYVDLAPKFFASAEADDKIKDLIQNLRQSNIFIDSANSSDIFQIHAKLRQWNKRRKLRLIVIDYLQLLKSIRNRRFENRNLEIAFWTRHLKEIAMEFNIPVLCLSQLSRNVEKRETKRPFLSDLRDSGSIEQDADLVLFLYREEYYLKVNPAATTSKKEYNYPQPHKAEIIIAKQRNGPTGRVEVLFIPNKATFMDYDAED